MIICSTRTKNNHNKKALAYIIGVSLGEGNLSNPNGRAVRPRITCDNNYPAIKTKIAKSLKNIFPENKVGFINKSSYSDISIYSNKLPKLLGWDWNNGPKEGQNIKIPDWIKRNTTYTKECLRGLLQTDGSIYKDRGYPMVNFINNSESLSKDVWQLICKLGYEPVMYKFKIDNGKIKNTIRLAKNTLNFIKDIDYWKR